MLVIAGKGFEYSARRSSFYWGKTWQSINNSTRFVLLVIDLKVVSRELLGPANLTRARAFCIHGSPEVWSVRNKNFVLTVPLLKGFNNASSSQLWVRLELIFVKASLVSEARKLGSSEPMAFADFSGLWGFSGFLTTFWQLFDRLATTTINPIIPDRSLGHSSWWVRWWACSEHWDEWRGNRPPWDRTPIEVG